MIKIKHGLPNHDLFVIVQPKNKEPYGKRINWDSRPGFTPVTYELEDKTGNKTKAELVDTLTFPVNQMSLFLTHLAYGLPPEKLKPVLLKKYPALNANPEVEFLLLRKL